MIIARAPFRVSFFGGGTDYPSYYLRRGGATLVTAIDKFATVTVQPLAQFFDHSIQVHYSRVEAAHSLEEIQIPVVRETLRLLGIEGGVEIHLAGDLPSRTGLGTSSATTVAMLMALHAFQGRIVDTARVAAEAVHVEQKMIGERVGSQDQYSSALGGFRRLSFGTDGYIGTQAVTLSRERSEAFQQHLMLFYTGLRRTAHDVLEQCSRSSKNVVF